MRIIQLSLTIVFTTLLISAIHAINDTQKAIVLINGEAYLVDVTDKGTIVTQYQKIDNYFSTAESHNSILARLSKGAVSQDGTSIVFYEKETEPIKSFTTENKAPITTGNAQYIGFSPRRALLKKEAVDQIRKMADSYQSGQIRNINITSYHRDDYRSRSLARNRANAIRDLLEAFGVSSSVIKTSTPYGGPQTKADFVNVSF